MGHILLAEDDAEMRWMVVEALHRDGHVVTSVSDGEGLSVQLRLALIRPPTRVPRRIDVLVSDVRMPGYSAFEVLERMDMRRWAVPVILMTAFGDAEARKRASDLGAILFDKPLALDLLRAEVNRLAVR
jgi:DNA-binding response OmpR family regulator